MCANQKISDVKQSCVDPTIHLPIQSDAQRCSAGNKNVTEFEDNLQKQSLGPLDIEENKKGPDNDENENKFENDRDVVNQESSDQKGKNTSGATELSFERFGVNRE